MVEPHSGSQSREGLPFASCLRLCALVRHDPDAGTTTIDGAEHKTVVNDPDRGIAALLESMDGFRTIGELSEAHELSGAVKELVTYLLKCGSIAVAEQLWRPFHTTTENPQYFGSAMTHDDVVAHTRRHTWACGPKPAAQSGSLLELAIERCSCRAFAPCTVSLADVRNLLTVAYSAMTRAVPSAGGLYSCRIDVLHRSGDGSLWRLYDWNSTEAALTESTSPCPDLGELQYALDSVSLLHGAAAVVVVSVDPEIHSAKYANRGYRYSLLEAGHVAQMIHLVATEQSLGALEWGAFNDRALAKLIRSGAFLPATVVGLGVASDDEQPHVREPDRASLASAAFSSFGDPLDDEGKPSGIVVAQIPLLNSDGQPTGSCATGAHWASSLAGVKARSEFLERCACGELRIDEVGSADALGTQYRVFSAGTQFPVDLPGFRAEPSEFAPFDASNDTYQWRVGVSEAEGATIVPVELVYFPVRAAEIGRKLCGTTTSSGVAAHSTAREARRSALLELIERDAFVRHWIEKRPPARVTPIAGLFDKKLRNLERLGIEVAFGQMDAVVPTIFCAAISRQETLLAFGLAADTSVGASVEKAFLDAYATYLMARRATSSGTGAHLRHYAAYQHPGSISDIRWFFDGPEQALSADLDEQAYRNLHAATCYVELDTEPSSGLGRVT